MKKCKRCGEMFTPKSARQSYCNQEKVRKCAICGKEIKYICNADYEPRTCSKECQSKLVKKNRAENVSKQIRICKACGKEFHPREYRDMYCTRDHYKECVICGKLFLYDPRRVNPNESNTCSKECKGKLMSKNHDYVKGAETYRTNMIEKYGVSNAMNIPGVIDKVKASNVSKYGKEWYTQTDEYKERVKQTNLDKYGVEHHLSAEVVQAKRKDTLHEKYGEEVDNVFQLDSVKEASKQTNIEKYGVEYSSQSKEVKAKTRETNQARYGVDSPMMLEEYKQKAIQTNIEKYGRVAYTQQHITNIQNWYRFTDNPRTYIQENYETSPDAQLLAHDLGVDVSTIDVYLKRKDSADCVTRNKKSLMKRELEWAIHEIDPEIRIIQNSRTIVDDNHTELDLYLPDYKFAIECDPTCTHNSSVADPWGGDPKPRSYHKRKTDLCEKKGIFLLHIFGYDWTHRKEIILSMIHNILQSNDSVIYGRKCTVKEVSGVDAANFLDANHRQGNASSPVRLGLYYNNELVSLMTFGHMRGTIGTGKEDLEDCWELVRFCSKINTSVIGAASKLLKHFVNNYNPERIRSFSDRAHTSGKLYKTLGFTEVTRSDPGYVWINVVSDQAFHRASTQKQNLKRFLKDDSIDLNKTEREIMVEHGYVQVFDSGTITWEWKNN